MMQYGTTSFDQVRCSGMNIQGGGNKLLSLSGANNQERASFAQDGTLSAPIGIWPATNSGAAYSVTIPGYVPGRVYYVQIGSAITATSTLSVNGGTACELDDLTGTAISKTAANAVIPVFQPDAVSNFLCLVKGGGVAQKTWSIYNIANAARIASDSSGYAYVACSTNSSSYPSVMKIDPQGNIVWSLNDIQNTSGIAVDVAGNIYVSYLNGSGPIVRKLSSSGSQIWAISDILHATNIKTDKNGYVYVVYGSMVYEESLIRKLDSSGNQIWSKSIALPSDISVDDSGNVYVSCFTLSSSYPSVCKYNSSGTLLWSLSDIQYANSIFVNSYGVCVGYSSGVRLLSASGSQQWMKTDVANASCVAIDSAGYVYVSYKNSSGVTSGKFFDNGTAIWSLSDIQYGSGISVDNLGFVYVTYAGSPTTYIPSIRKMNIGPP